MTHADFWFFQLARSFIGVASFRLVREQSMHGGLRVGIGPPPAAKGLDNVDETAVVLDPPLGSARLLLLLLGVNLGRLAANFAGTGERSVHLERTRSLLTSRYVLRFEVAPLGFAGNANLCVHCQPLSPTAQFQSLVIQHLPFEM